jgi:glycosyltransferase involved in cell wall biosynthesis
MYQCKKSLSVVSPIYNDLGSMPLVLGELVTLLKKQKIIWDILLIDDGSTDGSVDWIQRFAKNIPQIQVRYHAANKGIAKTYRELYQSATGDIVVLFSLDGQWDPADVVRLYRALAEKDVDMVIGVRKHKKYTVWRKVVSSIYNFLTLSVFGVATRDAGSIKAMRKILISTTPIISKGVFDEAERLIRAYRAGYRIGFIHVGHRNTKKEKSGIHFSHVIEAIIDSIRVYRHITVAP